MRMEFKNPEILISLFSPEDIVTTSNGNVTAAENAIKMIASSYESSASANTLSAAISELKFIED